MDNIVIEGNRILADFMGWQHHIDKQSDEYEMSALKYHSSWDWIIPVCEKFIKLSLYFDRRSETYAYIRRCDKLRDSICRFEVEAVWARLVETIRWYNSLTLK